MPNHAAIRLRRSRFWALVALAAIAAVIASLLVATSARAATVALSGVVRNASGTALAGVKVTALDLDEFSPSSTVTTTSSTGAFAFAALSPAQYTLSFSATSTTFFQYLGGTSDSANNEVISLGPTTNGNGDVYLPVDLTASGSLGGKVSRLPSGALKGYTVRAYQQNDDGSWTVAKTAVTSSTGAYSMTGLEPRFYRLEAIDMTSAHPVYAPVFSGGTTDVSTATSVGVLAGKTSSYNFSLGKSGSISGTVLGSYTVPSPGTEALAGVRVTAYKLAGTSFPYTSGTALDSPTTTTAANGTYTLSGLAPGAYTLEFQPPSTAAPEPSIQTYGRAFLGNTDSATSANFIVIGNGTAATGQSITLAPMGVIEGFIQDQATSGGLQNVQVTADYVGQDPDGSSDRAVTTFSQDADGHFVLEGLSEGTWDLYVGSNATTDPSDPAQGDTSWIRQIVPVTLTANGEVLTGVTIGMTTKNDDGMTATAAPALNTSGGTAVGDTVSTGNGTWNSTPTSYQYQWIDAGNVIPGATSSSYTLRPGNEGDYVWARVTASNFSYGTGTTTSSSIPGVQPGTMPAPSPGPSISGTAETGNVLTANTGYWPVPGTAFTFEWQTSSNNSTWGSLGLPSSPTLTVTSAVYNAGPYIRVEVFGTRAGYNGNSAYGIMGGPVSTAPITMVKAPSVVKTSTDYELVGGTFSPAAAATIATGTSWTYQSPQGGGGGTDVTDLPIASYVGDYIYVTQERQLAGYTTFTTPDILVQTGAAGIPSGNVAITGTDQVGAYLNAPNANWSNSSGTLAFQWQYKSGSTWRSITGATNNDYSPVAGDLGRLLRVIVTDHSTGFANGTLTSQATSAVAAASAPTIPANDYTGTVGTGDTVTATEAWTPSPTATTYQWEYSSAALGPYTKISKAAASSYLIPQSLLGKYLFVAETAAIPGHTTGTNLVHLGVVAPDQLTLVKQATVKHVGTQYIVTPPTFSPSVPAADVSYEWFYDNENDTSPTNALTNASSQDLDASVAPHAHWYVIAYVAAGHDGSYTYDTVNETLVRKGDIIPSATITLPTSKVGATITPSTITWFVQSPTLSHQWQYLSGTKWISISAAAGGTGATFTPTSAYLGKQVRVITTASRTNYNSDSVTSTATTVAIGDQLTPGTAGAAPQITGSVDIGQKLTVAPGTWSQLGVTFHYLWASSTDHSTWHSLGVTASTYVIPDAAFGALYYQVTITASKAGFTGGTATVETPGVPGMGTMLTTKQPIVKFAAGKYTVSGGAWSPAPTTGLDYTWVDFNPLTDEPTTVGSESSYTPLAGEAGHLIEVLVQARATNYTAAQTTLVAQAGGPIEPTSPITLAGTPVVNSNLNLDISGWNTDSPTVHILWYRNGVATGTFSDDSTYTLGSADFGKTISAKITASKTGYVGSTFTLSSTPTFSNVALAALTDPVISGTAAVDDTLTASTGVWNVASLTYAYQWYRDDNAIPGATASSYVPTATDVAEDITVGVTASKALYSPVTVTSQPVTAVYGKNIVNTAATPVTISGTVSAGTVALGHKLTATVGAWNMPVSLTYDWEYSTDGGTTWTYISGANAPIYTPEAGDDGNPSLGGLSSASGDQLELAVFATRPGHIGAEVASAVLLVQ